MPAEIYKDITGFEGLYKVSNLGNVWSVRSNRLLKPRLHSAGYHTINLTVKGVSTYMYIHRVVATEFLPNYENKGVVNHKNGIKTDNNVGNLEWVSQSENVQHAWDTFKPRSTIHEIDLIEHIDYEEEYRDMKGFEGRLKVSNYGNIYNVQRNIVMNTRINDRGYERIEFRYKGKRYCRSVHRLVAIAFLPNIENKPQVNHKNGVRDSNYVHNLEWCTPKENMLHRDTVLRSRKEMV